MKTGVRIGLELVDQSKQFDIDNGPYFTINKCFWGDNDNTNCLHMESYEH